jgi:hypothetical protein
MHSGGETCAARRLGESPNPKVYGAGRTMPEADRYLRLAPRTPDENRSLVEAFAALL